MINQNPKDELGYFYLKKKTPDSYLNNEKGVIK